MPKFSHQANCSSCAFQSPYLQSATSDELKLIKSGCLNAQFSKGEVIAKQGTQVTHAIYLIEGTVKVIQEGDNKNIIIKLVNQSNYVALQSLFNDLVYRVSVIAVEDCRMCMIAADQFLEVARTNNQFLFDITQNISYSVDCIHEKMITINQKQLRGRLADTLVYLAEKIYHNTTFTLLLTRKEVAELSAMSMENAVRALAEFKEEGLLEISGKNITIKHLDILKKISEIG